MSQLCSVEAVQVTTRLLELLSGSERVNPKEGSSEHIDAVSMFPAVSHQAEGLEVTCFPSQVDRQSVLNWFLPLCLESSALQNPIESRRSSS